MKVKDLIQQLQSENPEAIVIIQKDSEGNSYSPLEGSESGVYIPESTWAGEVYSYGELEDEGMELDEEKMDAVILWPVN